MFEKHSLDLSDPVALSYPTSYYGDETDDVLRGEREQLGLAGEKKDDSRN